jgi:uncharacterized protein (TIGR02757 family)
MKKENDLKAFLDRKLSEYSTKAFIVNDPISIPHQFRRKQDIEIAGFFAAIFAWGNRTTIIRKSGELMERMDKSPHEFCTQATEADLRSLEGFRHRTFNSDDLYYFIHFFQHHYNQHNSLEDAFTMGMDTGDVTVEKGINAFRTYFFSLEHLKRTEKHVSSPLQHSACKRINMFLRWMVRKDAVDFGIWKKISPAQLVCPLDLHVARVAKRFGLLSRPAADWASALELTDTLRRMDATDPVKYDLALFSLGASERY